jgi:hypothetical protein
VIRVLALAVVISDSRLLLFFYKEYNWLLTPELVPRRMAPVASSLAEDDDRI